MTTLAPNWQAPKNTKLADFIICGAMKSGTTTLRTMLNQHPDVFIPETEINFFDLDNPLEHPDFNQFNKDHWQGHHLDNNSDKYWQWYSQKFSSAEVNQVLGEDSTTYLASSLAAKRIAMQNKNIKLIVMLRQPSKRAYSQYWHLLRTGRARYSFENTLQLNPASVLNRSMYLMQINNLLKYIPKERIKFIIFEEFIDNKKAILEQVCDFINVSFDRLPNDAVAIHSNITMYPKYYRLQLLKNNLFPMAGNLNYRSHFNLDDEVKPSRGLLNYVNSFYRILNPLVTKKSTMMNAATLQFLDDFFKRELEGLNDIIGQDALSLWFK